MPADKLRIAVTGANGLVGSGVVAHALHAGHHVLALDIHPSPLHPPQPASSSSFVPTTVTPWPRPSSEMLSSPLYTYKQVDCTQYEAYEAAVREAGCNALVHLAVILDKRDENDQAINPTPQWKQHNISVTMSWNTLMIASELGIDRVVMASSVNAIGMIFCERPTYDYLPLDEKHAFRPPDAYSVSKQIAEIQSDAACRKNPSLRVATMRFHAVLPDDMCHHSSPAFTGKSWKDLWGWVSLSASAQACLSALTVPESQFPLGHETFFIVAPTTQSQRSSRDLIRETFPALEQYVIGDGWDGHRGFFDTSKAERLLGWKEVIDAWA